MKATATPQQDAMVKITVEVDESELHRVIEDAIKTITRQARIPGFRPGKVPRQVLEARMGGMEGLRAEALSDALPDFYKEALIETDTEPIAEPEIDITEGKEAGPLSFDALVAVRPSVPVAGYEGIEVTVPRYEVKDEDIDAQIDRMREVEAELSEVERPAQSGDVLRVSVSEDGEEGTVTLDDALVEIGKSHYGEDFDEKLQGARTGDVVAFEFVSNDQPLHLKALVKEVKEKKLPALTDTWVQESSEFATLQALRDDLSAKISKQRIQMTSRARAGGILDALAGLVDDEAAPESLVRAELNSQLHDLSHRLESIRASLDDYVRITGMTQEQLYSSLFVRSLQEIKIDLALRSIAEKEALTADESDVDAEIAKLASTSGVKEAKVRDNLAHSGRMPVRRSQIRKDKAFKWLLGHVDLVDEEGVPVDGSPLVSTETDAANVEGDDR